MKVPKEVKIYCKKCNEHTEHKLKQFKEGSKSSLKEHARKHEAKHVKGYGGKSRHVVHIKKQSKNLLLQQLVLNVTIKNTMLQETKVKET